MVHKLFLLKFAGFIDPKKRFLFVSNKRIKKLKINDYQMEVLKDRTIHFLRLGGSLTSEEILWLSEVEEEALLQAQIEFQRENLIEDETIRRVDDKSISSLLDKGENLTTEEKKELWVLSGVMEVLK